MQEDAPDEMVAEAAQISHAHDLIVRLPNGYETRIGDGGVGLSGGQRQRVGLARAVYGVPPLLVLDEPNSNLDQAGESALAQAILELKQLGSTLLIVGHRPSTLAQADRVLLLAEGMVRDFGPRDEVLARMREATQAEAADTGRGPGEAERPAARKPEAAKLDQVKDGDTLQLGPYRTASKVAGE